MTKFMQTSLPQQNKLTIPPSDLPTSPPPHFLSFPSNAQPLPTQVYPGFTGHWQTNQFHYWLVTHTSLLDPQLLICLYLVIINNHVFFLLLTCLPACLPAYLPPSLSTLPPPLTVFFPSNTLSYSTLHVKANDKDSFTHYY